MIDAIFPCYLGQYQLDIDDNFHLFNQWLEESERLYKDDINVNKSLKGDIQTHFGHQVSFQKVVWESDIPGLAEIWKQVEKKAAEYLQYVHNDKKMFPQYINGWAVRYGSGAYQGAHLHRNADYTMILYTSKENLEGGELILHNPATVSQYGYHPSYKSYNIEEGMLMILPSWLVHSVNPIISGKRNIAVFDIKAHRVIF